MFSKRFTVSTLFALLSTPALAHAGGAGMSGFFSGFMHPIAGADHVLAMVAVGLLAPILGGQALWAVPGSFVLMMLVGGALGFSGINIPAAEIGILASIVVLGSAVATGRSWATGTAALVVGAFAVFHGYAHGVEMPAAAGATAYSLGFATATALLHGAGVLAGMTLFGKPQVVRLAGAATAVAGFAVPFM
ncbi:HupE/UreJ family protein [Microvirga aerophila]|uniref:Urease accessory protein UreJ n=1 Tax=Microvirga aerophila TaxID=670291 RepID=A0A512BMU6_9HYPH|nr:HupE/UreJ family protein [Microvirga aerophila]GEO13197.1 urease accessory protein UreJ [Microvirga aerophila]